MAVLCDFEIVARMFIDPCAEGVKRPGKISYGVTSYGYDLRVGTKFKILDRPASLGEFEMLRELPVIDPKAGLEKLPWIDVDTAVTGADHIIIPPNSFALAETVETLDIPRDIIAIVVGKSTYARCGIIVNVTPLEPEWRGKVTMEISNTTPLPVKVYANEGIAQAVFFTKKLRTCRKSYADKRGKYQSQEGLTLPKVD